MTTIYVVTAGEYSDYHIVAVFDNEPMATAFLSEYGRDATLEEYEANAGYDPIRQGRKRYSFHMYRNGDTGPLLWECFADETYDTEFHLTPRIGRLVGYALHCAVWAKDRQHAAKIANERRAQLIASGKWPGVD